MDRLENTNTHLRPRSLQLEHCGCVPVLEKGKSFRSQRTLFPQHSVEHATATEVQ